MMASREDIYQTDLLRLIREVARIEDFSHLEHLEAGAEKALLARNSVIALKKLSAAHEVLYGEQQKAEERRRLASEALIYVSAVKSKLDELTEEYIRLLGSEEPHRRGYRLEKIVRELFDFFDLDPKASFKIVGEQIDGAFTYEGTDYLFEGKWQKELVSASDLNWFSIEIRSFGLN